MKRLLILAGVVLCLASCGSKDKLIGTWTATTTVQNQVGTETTEIKADGTYTTVVKMTGNGNRALIATDKGTWQKPDADHIKMTMKDTDWSIEGGNAADQKKVADLFGANKKSIIESTNKMPPLQITWKDDDHLTLTGTGTSRLFTRQK